MKLAEIHEAVHHGSRYSVLHNAGITLYFEIDATINRVHYQGEFSVKVNPLRKDWRDESLPYFLIESPGYTQVSFTEKAEEKVREAVAEHLRNREVQITPEYLGERVKESLQRSFEYEIEQARRDLEAGLETVEQEVGVR